MTNLQDRFLSLAAFGIWHAAQDAICGTAVPCVTGCAARRPYCDALYAVSPVLCTKTLEHGLQFPSELNRPSPPGDDWELEPSEIAFQEKIASGAFGDLYKGAYCGQDVAIKIVRNVQDNTQQFQEFLQVPCLSVPPRSAGSQSRTLCTKGDIAAVSCCDLVAERLPQEVGSSSTQF